MVARKVPSDSVANFFSVFSDLISLTVPNLLPCARYPNRLDHATCRILEIPLQKDSDSDTSSESECELDQESPTSSDCDTDECPEKLEPELSEINDDEYKNTPWDSEA
jgi:hypothetical protein